MANPLAAFRKHQKKLLLAAALGAMVAFGILPVVSDWVGSSGAGGQVIENKVAVRWDGGELRENDLYNYRVLRNHLRNFQQAVIQTTLQRGAQPRKVVVPNSLSDESMIQSILLAKEAEKMGIYVGDKAVLNYLTQQLANDTIDGDELAAILKQVTNGQLGQQALFDGLRTELAANQIQVLANSGAYTGGVTDTAMTPAESFDYFKRLTRRMEAEVVALPVARFADQVTAEPPAEEIEALFEEYKEVLPNPASPTPGFKRPQRVAFQVLKADFQTMLEREKANLSEEEIVSYYEENKNTAYRKVSLPSLDDISSEATDEDATATPPADDSSDSSQVESAPQDQQDTSPQQDGSADEDAGENSEDAAAAEDVDEVDELDLTPPATSNQDQPSGDSAAETDNPNASGAGADAVSDIDEAGGDANDAEEVSEAESASAESQPAADVAAETDPETAGTEPTEESEEKVEYYPLEEVRDDIARALASPRAREAVSEAVDEATAELKSFFDDQMYWETLTEEERKTETKPTPPNLRALADRLGMVASEIPLITLFDVEEYEIGDAFDINFGTMQRVDFAMMGFNPNLAAYNPQKISSGSDPDSTFVFWKVDEEEAYAPTTLEEAKADVVAYWKMQQAIELAKQRGRELIEEAKAENASLQTAFDDDEAIRVVDTGEFTWMTFGGAATGQGTPRLGFVGGVEFPGDEFMRDVSQLNPGEFTVTTNYPQATVYVVYMKGVTANEDELRQRFLTEGITAPVVQISRRENALAASEWYQAFEDEMQLSWERPPVDDFGREPAFLQRTRPSIVADGSAIVGW